MKARREQAEIERLFGLADIPRKYRGAALADFPARLRTPVASQMDSGRGVFLVGGYGVGKTRLLIAALHARIRVGESALYLTVPDLLTRIKSTFNRRRDEGAATEDELLSVASTVKWLGLDDLGVEDMTPWARTELYQIVNARYNADLPIVCTSNLTFDDLEAERMVGGRIVSRLRELCGRPIRMDGPDLRETAE